AVPVAQGPQQDAVAGESRGHPSSSRQDSAAPSPTSVRSSGTTASALARASAESSSLPGAPTGVARYPSRGEPVRVTRTNSRRPAGEYQPVVTVAVTDGR